MVRAGGAAGHTPPGPQGRPPAALPQTAVPETEESRSPAPSKLSSTRPTPVAPPSRAAGARPPAAPGPRRVSQRTSLPVPASVTCCGASAVRAAPRRFLLLRRRQGLLGLPGDLHPAGSRLRLLFFFFQGLHVEDGAGRRRPRAVPPPGPAAGGQQRPVGRAGGGGRRGGGGGGGFLPEGAVSSLLALQQAALAGPPVLEAAVGRQAAPARRATRRRGVAEQFPAEAKDVLHVEVFPARAGHGAEAGGGRGLRRDSRRPGRAGRRRRRLLRAALQGEGWQPPAGERCAHTPVRREREDGWMERCTEPRGGRDTQHREGRGRDAQS